MTQRWEKLLFAHWPVAISKVRELVPDCLEVESFDGFAWIGVVPFLMNNVGFRTMPPVVGLNRFLELNVRTYVSCDGVSGVYFFSLDCENPIAVEVARQWFGLPYLFAEMRQTRIEDWYRYRSLRSDRRADSGDLICRYRPIGELIDASVGSIEHFLTERYCLYSFRSGSLMRGDVHHIRWPLQVAEAEFELNTMTSPLGIELSGKPLLHYSEGVKTFEWAPQVVM